MNQDTDAIGTYTKATQASFEQWFLSVPNVSKKLIEKRSGTPFYIEPEIEIIFAAWKASALLEAKRIAREIQQIIITT